MARTPLLQISDVALTFGGDPVFDGLDLTIQGGDRLALVGRNGSGKSTLMKVMDGVVEPDRGGRVVGPGITVARLEQAPDITGHATLGDFATAGLEPGSLYKAERAAAGLGFNPDIETANASGGQARRAALARMLADGPDLMLLDEPTNHLDISAIRWLEAHLSSTRAAFVLISHDRAFVTALARATLWIDRGQVRRIDKGFEAFEDWRDTVWAEEDLARHKLDRKIKAEARWAVEGISARRKRNQGRVRALQDLRAERSGQIRRQGTAALELGDGPKSGKRVVEAQGVSHAFGDLVIARNLDLRVARTDRIAFVGPNGVGKTTLIEILTGQRAPDQGRVTLGTTIEMAVFDQKRAALDPKASLWETMTGDPASRVPGRADQVMVRGTPRHVVGYLKDFLFDESQIRGPVSALSGGEAARLLLARIMARPSNLLVLDEPTNDLDIETLDLLQEVLGDYDGTVLLVSHDRDFIDRIATTTLLMEGQGKITVHAGGWSDVAPHMPAFQTETDRVAKKASKPTSTPTQKPKSGLTFTQEHRLKELPAHIARLEAEIAKLEDLLGTPDLFETQRVKFEKASEALVERHSALSEAEEEWLMLA
ncbi:MAG: ATP-binding cassette domain-containing protein, partial [Pseudomonadota bacterium]